ncbi:MAG: LamG-like jellyroll fold domain-containing protein, partial [Terracidiphilus sp.]
MLKHPTFSPAAGVRLRGRAVMQVAVAVVAAALAAQLHAQAPAPPAAAYGPFNAVFLADGPGLNKPLSPSTSLDGLAAVAMDGQGSGQPSMQDPILAGRASWTLAFWFESPEPKQGTALLAGIGDPAAEDARFIGIEDNRLGLWLGRAQSSAGFVPADQALDAGKWHMAAAVSDGEHVVLYADGQRVAASGLAQGSVAALLEMAPPLPDVGTTHFGGKIASLKIYRGALTAEQVKAIADAPPDFSLATYEEASQHWPVQTRAQAGYSAPQDPSTMPRGKSEIQKPVAKEPTAADLHCQLKGDSPWKLAGGWRLEAAPHVSATGEEISKAGFDDKGWLVATVPGTVLTTMIDRGLYPDPDYGLNNLAIPESLARQDYWYRVEFKTPAAARGRSLTLTFEGVNYATEVWMNGKKLGGFTGAFLRGKFDVTDVAAGSENALAVRVSPPPHPGIPNEQSIKGGPGENGGIEVLDGPTFSAAEGWDWIPGIRDRDTGIWQDVTLTATGPAQIGDLNVITTLPKPDRSEADIEIEAPLTNTGAAAIDGELTASFDDVKVTKHVHLAPGETVIRLEPAEFADLKVQNPRLWWPNGYGEPALHALKVSLTTDGKASAAK